MLDVGALFFYSEQEVDAVVIGILKIGAKSGSDSGLHRL